MNKNKDWDKVALLERAVEEKYGNEAIKNLKQFAVDVSEEDKQEFSFKVYRTTEKNVTLKHSELINDSNSCPCCGKYHIYFTIYDDINISRFDACATCFYKYIDGREERWLSGWRPKNNGSI